MLIGTDCSVRSYGGCATFHGDSLVDVGWVRVALFVPVSMIFCQALILR
jgi:hypothetical protein